ncbi:MAG: nitroreductase family deazaflavin-dependent oxidoreductase [Myxococcota bacterium]|nr:nitroreductase family deazaflavin-dependent oxidoreductase [Myxococcales bacterium]
MAVNPMTEQEYARTKKFVKHFAKLNVLVYRLTGGRLMGTFQGREVCLVKMKGAKSGVEKWIPLMYVPIEEGNPKAGAIIVASLGGAPKHPVWYHNLVKHPDVEVQYKSDVVKLRARRVSAEEKARLWPTCVKHYPPFEEYQARTDRDIPVFACEPRA